MKRAKTNMSEASLRAWRHNSLRGSVTHALVNVRKVSRSDTATDETKLAARIAEKAVDNLWLALKKRNDQT